MLGMSFLLAFATCPQPRRTRFGERINDEAIGLQRALWKFAVMTNATVSPGLTQMTLAERMLGLETYQ